MHDVLEGIAEYELALILNYIINKQKLFDIDTLNYRLRSYNIEPFNSVNKPLLITQECFRKKRIKSSAAEMQFLISHLGMIIGDLIDENNKVWAIYLLLADICYLMINAKVNEETVLTLESVIKTHHQLLIDVFKVPLKS